MGYISPESLYFRFLKSRRELRELVKSDNPDDYERGLQLADLITPLFHVVSIRRIGRKVVIHYKIPLKPEAHPTGEEWIGMKR
jgi:hypothetical protein